jgi:hypothetical protein
MTGDKGTWSAPPANGTQDYAYQWRSCTSSSTPGACSDIPGEIGTTYTVAAADVGKFIRLRVTATDHPPPGGASFTADSAATQAVLGDPANETLPTITGIPTDQQALTAHTAQGDWRSPNPPFTFSYQWRSCNSSGATCVNVGGNSTTYNMVPADVGHRMRVIVTAQNTTAATAAATSGPTAVVKAASPSNSSPPQIFRSGRKLTANTGSWNGTPPLSFAYQWRRCGSSSCSPIPGASKSTYTLVTADIGKYLRVAVTAHNSGANTVANSIPTSTIAAAPPSNFDPPTISGSPQPDQRLSSTLGSWNSQGPIAYRRAWLRCRTSAVSSCSAIVGRAGTYRVVDADAHNFLRLRVIAEGLGSTQAFSAPVSVSPNPAPPAPTLLSPFPRVRIAGRAFLHGSLVTRLAVRAPENTKIVVRCKSRFCPYSRAARRGHGATIRFRRLQRVFPPGAVIRIWVVSPTQIGKFTRFRFRALMGPSRVDRCLRPNGRRPIRCP